jgi:endonuclease-3
LSIGHRERGDKVVDGGLVREFSRQKRESLMKRLAAAYPNPKSELNFSDDYQLVVAVVLSAQCTDKKVNQVTPTLFERYTTFQSLAAGSVEEIEAIIKPINYYRTKARNIRALAEQVVERWGGQLPATIDDLQTLPGVGRKTANVVASERGTEAGLAVDTHVFRVSRRLGLARGKDAREVEEELRGQFPKKRWRALHHSLILHGRAVCTARNPRCDECVLSALCAFNVR